MPAPFSSRYQHVLGTDLHLLVATAEHATAERAEARILDEIARLGALLSTYDASTPLSRWMRGGESRLPVEVQAVLALAQDWYAASGGAFHPGLGRLRSRWREAERDGRLPGRSECADLAAAAHPLPYAVRDDGGRRQVERLGDCRALDLDALAKGWIVDRAAEAGRGQGVDWVMVNVGGDLRVAGPGSVTVGVEDPASRLDNAAPLGVVTVGGQGLASSGSARRGYRVGDQWLGHVLDPHTGWPMETSAGVTVVGPDACTADALATVVGVNGVDHPRAAALLRDHRAAAVSVGAGGDVTASPGWSAYVDSGFVSGLATG